MLNFTFTLFHFSSVSIESCSVISFWLPQSKIFTAFLVNVHFHFDTAIKTSRRTNFDCNAVRFLFGDEWFSALSCLRWIENYVDGNDDIDVSLKLPIIAVISENATVDDSSNLFSRAECSDVAALRCSWYIAAGLSPETRQISRI